MKKFLMAAVILSLCNPLSAKHLHKEKEYVHIWCKANGGIEEYRNGDCTRVDCLTDKYAVEFDFAKKWAESVGQVLYYKLQTKRQGKVILIMEDEKREMIYYQRARALSDIYGFEVEYVTDKIFRCE